MSATIIETRIWGETYALRADWSRAECPIERGGEDGWFPTGQQVADYIHNSRAALRAELVSSAISSGCGVDEDGEIDADEMARINRAVARAIASHVGS